MHAYIHYVCLRPDAVPLAPKKAYSASSAVGSSQVVNNIVVAPPLPPSKTMTGKSVCMYVCIYMSIL